MALSDSTRVRGEGKLGGGQVLVATGTEVDVFAEGGWILRHLKVKQKCKTIFYSFMLFENFRTIPIEIESACTRIFLFITVVE